MADNQLSRRRFIQAGGSLLAAALVGCEPDDSPPPPEVTAGRFAEDFAGSPSSRWDRWVSFRPEIDWRVDGRGAGYVAAGPAVPKSVAADKEVALYMGEVVVYPGFEAAGVEVRVRLRVDGPGEAGVVVRASFDQAYALLLDGRELLLCRYDAVDRTVLTRADFALGPPGSWNTLRLRAVRGRVDGDVSRAGRSARVVADDADPLEPGYVGCLVNPTSSEKSVDAGFQSFTATSPDPLSDPRPRFTYRFAGAVVADGGGAYKARLTARTDIPQPIAFEVSSDESFSRSLRTDYIDPGGTLGAAHTWVDVQPGTTHYWRPVARRGKETLTGPPARLRTPPPPGGAVRFVFASCTSGRVTNYPSFEVARRFDPDFYLHAGDWGYADLTAYQRRADHFQARWVRLLREANVARLLDQCPLMFWQDDHDYQADNGWSETVQQYAVDAFDELHANPSDDYFDIRWGDVHVWCLDCRLHATDPSAPDGPGKSRLGAAQKEWLLTGMSASDAPVKVVGSAMVFRNKPDDDPGWHNDYAYERDELLGSFSNVDGTVFILSGDSHGQRLIHHHEFGELYEFNCSGTDFPAGDQGNNDPDHTLVNLSDSGFALIELDAAGPNRYVTVRSVATADGSTLFDRRLPVEG